MSLCQCPKSGHVNNKAFFHFILQIMSWSSILFIEDRYWNINWPDYPILISLHDLLSGFATVQRILKHIPNESIESKNLDMIHNSRISLN